MSQIAHRLELGHRCQHWLVQHAASMIELVKPCLQPLVVWSICPGSSQALQHSYLSCRVQALKALQGILGMALP